MMVVTTSRSKVLIVTALAGFVKSFLMQDVATLQSMGYEVHCAANANHAGAEGVVDFLQERNVVFHQVDFSSSRIGLHESSIALRQMGELASAEDFEFVHCHTPIAGAICRVAFRKLQRRGLVRVAYTTHGFYFHNGADWKAWFVFRTIEDLMSRWSDTMITINREDYGNALRMHCPDVRYIPGVGADIDKFRDVKVNRVEYRQALGLCSDDFVVLAVGEISARKNQKVIVEALSRHRIPNAVFVICGNCITGTDTKREIEELASKSCVDIRFLGRRSDVAEICKCADVGVLPSIREGLGLAGIEMLAAGLPVVGSDVHGIPDYLIDGYNGFLCSPHDADAFEQRLACLCDSDLRRQLGANGYKSVRQFSVDESARCMARIYRDILGRGDATCT